jgi:hypothetical protein
VISTYEYNGTVYRIDINDTVDCNIYRYGKLVYSDKYGIVKETKMTRDEAIDIYSSHTGAVKASSRMFLDAIEALGLIKFDEPEKLSPTEIFKKIYNEYKSGLTAEAFIKRLNYEGVYIEDLNPK